MSPWLQEAHGVIPRERVATELARVLHTELERPDSMLADVLAWLSRHGLGPELGEWIGRASRVLPVLLAVVVGVLALRAARERVGARLAEGEPGRRYSVRERVSAILADAARARDAGDLRLALRQTFFALVLGLGERGDLGYHRAWTNRELLRRGRPSPGARDLLEGLVEELEEKEFGLAPISLEDVLRLEELCRENLGELARPAGGAA